MIKTLLSFILIIFLAVACTGVPDGDIGYAAQSPTANAAVMVASVSSVTHVPLQASTFTASVVVTPSITLSSLPTLTLDEAKITLFNLLLDNGGCTLPCLLGNSPDISAPKDFQLFFKQFGIRDNPEMSISSPLATDRSIIRFFIKMKENYLNMGVSTYEDNNQIEALGMGSFSQPEWEPLYAEVMQYYMLPQILTKYGKPSQILILTYRNDRQRPDVTTAPFHLVLLYPSQGFFVEYEMNRETKEDKFVGCPSKSFVSIATWNPQNDKAFGRVTEGTMLGIHPDSYKPIANAAFMTIDEFYQVFSNSDNKTCIETPIETWPNP